MKILLFASIMSILTLNLSAQKIIEKQFDVSATGKIDIDLKFADLIKITTWNSNKVSFKASIDLNNGLYNDSLKHEFTPVGNSGLTIKSSINKKFNNWMSKKNYDPENENIKFWTGNESFIISEIIYEIKVPEKCLLSLNSLNADIEIRDLKNTMAIKTINGFIDINWQENDAANFEMKTINGEIYSDLEELNLLNRKEHPMVGYNLKASYKSNPSTSIKLETINGNVYLRKAKGL
ncbi:hypothetical protein [Chondrinema litorale]|uniref:hypothetical protein n=1 Tax=Chondrinema litorale TaxID=2994555 RepID=UPI002543C2DC|nr:hypothetical protein [Chondrinema litorale]UZR94072.1 hypothetical protein OQ292_19705 [Chondrinema litorale]